MVSPSTGHSCEDTQVIQKVMDATPCKTRKNRPGATSPMWQSPQRVRV